MDVRSLHSEAMDLAEKAMIERARGRPAAAQKHLAEALKKEEKAARLAVHNGAPEPTRSILLKSAAHLAVDAGELRLAEQLIAIALAGEPPDDMAAELRTLFEEVRSLLRKPVSSAAKPPRVAVRGAQASKTVLRVEEFKATRGRKP